jgi:serine protease Do
MAARLCSATPGRDVVSLKRAVKCLRVKPPGLLLAAAAWLAALLLLGTPKAAQVFGSARSLTNTQPAVASDTNTLGVPAVPRPAPARRSALPAVFSKAGPTSVADLRAIERHVKALAAKVSPAVVAVQVGTGSGSGVVISADGLVLTAGHVCGWPGRNVQFTFPDGKTVRGKTLGVNRDSDTGLMRITDRGPWPHAPMGDLEQARIGDWTLAMGHPGGFDLRRSLVVRLGRIIQLASDALQTDCTISPGDSGGPLFDMHGRVIGIHSAISTAVEDNFHVAVTEFYDSWNVLVTSTRAEDPTRALGIYFGATGVDDAAGCRLTVLDSNSPASRAGLKTGDVVCKVNGREIRGAVWLQRWLAEAEPGELLNLEVKRGEKVLSLDVRVEAPRRLRRGGSTP